MSTGLDYSQKKIRFTAVLLFYTGAFLLTFYGTLELTGRPSLCLTCHMMKPEYYTWQASSHKKIKCVSCHVPPGLINAVKYRFTGLKKIYYTAKDSYTSPILLLNPVTDAACSRCHNMNTRIVDPSGDVIIPHKVHAKNKIECSKCHVGVAHGNIARRKVTYVSDYPKWDSSQGINLMSDNKFTLPDMDACMRCHKVRNASLACKACHTSTMLPEDHRNDNFKYRDHGKLAARDVNQCDTCHGYMTHQKTEEKKERVTYQDYLRQLKGFTKPKLRNTVLPVISYAKSNDYCRECHGKRPPSHIANTFIANHGQSAKSNKDRCMTCHNYQEIFGPKGVKSVEATDAASKVACSSCHPSIHSRSVQWKQGYHLLPLPAKPRLNKSCYTCHSNETCGRCHGKI